MKQNLLAVTDCETLMRLFAEQRRTCFFCMRARA